MQQKNRFSGGYAPLREFCNFSTILFLIRKKFDVFKKIKIREKKMGRDRNFKQPNLERPILRNLKIANVKSYERSSNSIFLFTNLFFHFFF